MIIYQMKKPIKCYDTDCVGVTGDNIAYTQYFYIKDVSDDSISYTLHLRFADGSVNSITPDIVIPDGEGTEIRWIVKKNDIFMHGYFELQIEGRNKFGLVFQTEIVMLYADESLPVEDREYENPNSETVKLREEAYAALEEIKKQQSQIDDNVKKIEQTDLNNKADKATTLAGYGITDGENISNKVTDKSEITDEYANYPSIKYLNGYYYDYNEVDEALSGKLDNASGAVKTDNIANKAVTSDKLASSAVTSMKIANNAVAGNHIAQYQIGTAHLMNGIITTEKLADEVKSTISSKYDSSNIETGSGDFTVFSSSSDKINSANFEYQKIGDWVNLHIYVEFKSFTPLSVGSSITLTGLPFICKNTVNPRELCITTQKKQLAWAMPVGGNGIAILFLDTSSFIDGEKLSFSTRYKTS